MYLIDEQYLLNNGLRRVYIRADLLKVKWIVGHKLIHIFCIVGGEKEQTKSIKDAGIFILSKTTQVYKR